MIGRRGEVAPTQLFDPPAPFPNARVLLIPSIPTTAASPAKTTQNGYYLSSTRWRFPASPKTTVPRKRSPDSCFVIPKIASAKLEDIRDEGTADRQTETSTSEWNQLSNLVSGVFLGPGGRKFRAV